MSVTAPARPVEISDPVEGDRFEALIEEAKHRARRRRAKRIAAALALVIAVVTAYASRGGAPPSEGASVGEPDRAPALAARMDPDEGAKVVAEWSELHVGWVLVYGDGRAIQQSDGGLVLERQLSQRGWSGLRSGDIDPVDFVTGWDPDVQESLWWVDAAGAPYEPSTYAVCSTVVNPVPEAPNTVAPLDVIDDYPAAVRPMLRGRERTYTSDAGMSDSAPTTERCFELASTEALMLSRYLTDPVGEVRAESDLRPYAWAVSFHSPRGRNILVDFRELLPHGEWVLSGG